MRFKEFLLEKQGASAKVGITFDASIPVDSHLYDNSSDETSADESIHKAAESLSEALGSPVKVTKSDAPRSNSAWTIQPRDSTSWAHGVKILSPMDPIVLMLRNVKMLSDWMIQNGLKTSDSDIAMAAIGVHGIEERLDPVKLVFFMDGTSAANAFATMSRKYTSSQIETLAHKIKTIGKLPSTSTDMIKAAERYLGKRANGHTNFENMDAGVIEFKVASGAGYEHDVDQIRKKISKLTEAVEIAVDSSQNRSLYVQKMMTLFNPDGDPVLPVTDNKKIPTALERLYRFEPEIYSGWRQYSAEAEHGAPRAQLLVLINTAMKAAKKQNTSLTSDEKSFFKKLIRQTALQGADVDEYYDHDHITRLRFKTDFGV